MTTPKPRTAADRVALARNPLRPSVTDYIDHLFTGFFELCGDRRQAEDASILGGLAFYKGTPVTVIGHRKGKTLEENLRMNFGMSSPEGYRKAQRLMRQAEKFKRPIITFIDTPGAYPGIEAEARGQGVTRAVLFAANEAAASAYRALGFTRDGTMGVIEFDGEVEVPPWP